MDQEEKDNKPENNGPEISLAEQAREICQKLIQFFPLSPLPRVRAWEEDNKIMLEIEGDKSGILIGKHGLTLNSLEFIVARIFQHQAQSQKPVLLDCENYRKRKRGMLEKLALETAQEVAETQEPVALGAMDAEERKIIHLTLKNHPEVYTESTGLPPNRQVVIKPKEKNKEE